MKKYIAIITEDNGDYQFDYLCDNPWDGNFRSVIYGDNAEEIVSDNGDLEGLFYQMYDTDKGKRVGYGVFNYDDVSNDIRIYTNKNGIVIDDKLYMIKTVDELAKYTVSDLNYDGIENLIDNNHKFIDCDFCTIDQYSENVSIREIVTYGCAWHGIKAIDIGFTSSDLDIATDYYGGGCLQTVSLNYEMNKEQCIEFVEGIIIQSLDDNGENVDSDMLLLVEVKGAGENEK